MRYLIRLVACWAILTATAAQADLPMSWIVEHADKQGDEGDLVKIYLAGVVDGYGWANAKLSNNGEKLLFCQPAKLALQPDQIVSIFMAFAKKWRGDSKAPAGIIMLLALEETFPCEPK